MDAPLRALLDGLFRTAVAAAHPSTFLPPLLPPPPKGRLILLAAGKAAGSMAEVAEARYLDNLRIVAERLSGVAVARHGYGRHLRRVPLGDTPSVRRGVEAVHPRAERPPRRRGRVPGVPHGAGRVGGMGREVRLRRQ